MLTLFIKRRRIMREIIKNNLKFLVFLTIFGLVGGYFTALYSIETLSNEMLEDAISQVGSVDTLIIVTTLQSLGYALILGIIGKVLAKKIGLWRDVEFNKKGNIELILVTLVGGTAFILFDVFIFGSFSEVIKNSYAIKPTLEYIIASVTYGAVIEEVMLRLFFMTLIALIIQKLAKKESMNNSILIIANIIAAMLFAAGHLPATVSTIGTTPMILIRCFVMNGGFGLLFGRLYRKYGIHYAMLAHGGLHIVSKLIWILFI
mgnify:CR=1 FL=1